MYRVSTVNLSADATQADVAFGTAELGELPPGDVIALLERFRGLDVIQNQEVDPHVVLIGRSGKFHVRTGQGKLFLYNARATIEPYAELTAPEIIAQLERDNVTVAPFAHPGDTDSPGSARTRPAAHHGIAAAILVAGLSLNGYTLYSAFYTEKVNERPAVTLVVDAAEASARQREIAGTYATGDRPGDRVIIVKPDGHVEFSEIAAKGLIAESRDTYRLGRRNTKLCLVTPTSGVVDLLNLETLTYYGDTYRRK